MLNRYFKFTYSYSIPIILLIITIIIYRKFRNQKRLLNATIDLPSLGFVFFVNKIGRLIRVNESGKQLLKITDSIPLKQHFSEYCNTEQSEQLVDLVDRGLINKIPFEQKINVLEREIRKE